MNVSVMNFAEPDYLQRLGVVGMVSLNNQLSAVSARLADEKAALNGVVSQESNVHLALFAIGMPIGLHVDLAQLDAAGATVNLTFNSRADEAIWTSRRMSGTGVGVAGVVVALRNAAEAGLTVSVVCQAFSNLASRAGLAEIDSGLSVGRAVVFKQARMAVRLFAVTLAKMTFRTKVIHSSLELA